MIKSIFGRIVSIWFALFLISGCLLLMPFFWILIGIGSKKTLNAAHFLNRLWAFFITIPSFIFINKKTLHKLKRNKKYIFVGNHQSYLDIPVCLIALPVSFRFIGKAELGPENEETILRESGRPMIGLAIAPQPGANYIAIADEFYKRLEQIKKDLPKEYTIGIALDNTKFVI
jgi:ACR3 family arsenite efflux pump ArsB